jgi:predicted nucleotidyltransferase
VRPGLPELPVLDDAERSCLARYLQLLVDTVTALEEVWLFGSVARGESWPEGMPIRSDLDLLVVTTDPLADAELQRLVEATLPLFLECGRQIAPQFRTAAQLARPNGGPGFVEQVRGDGIRLWPASG